MDFYSDIHLQHQKNEPQTNDVNATATEDLYLSHLYPLAGGIPYYDCEAYKQDTKTFNLNKATAIGRYYCNTNNKITKLYNDSELFIEGNCIFELIVNERIGDFIKTNADQNSYYIQTLRIHQDLISTQFLPSDKDECLIEFRRHFEITTSKDSTNATITFGVWNLCYTPTINSSKQISLPNLILDTYNTAELGAKLALIDNDLNSQSEQIQTLDGNFTSEINDINKRLDALGFNTGVVQFQLVDSNNTPQINWTNCGQAIKNGNIYIGCVSELAFNIHWYDNWIMRIRFVFDNTPQQFKWGIGSFPMLYQGNPYSSPVDILAHQHGDSFPVVHKINGEKEFTTIGWEMKFMRIGDVVNGHKYTCVPFIWICGTGSMPNIFD